MKLKISKKKNNTIDAHVDRVLVSNGAIVGKIASARYLITGATVEVERVCSIVILSAVQLLCVDTVNMHFNIKKGSARILKKGKVGQYLYMYVFKQITLL